MKKILIALPLVLVMLLSLIPVMAEETVSVPITAEYFEKPESATPYTTRNQDVQIAESIASDKAKLEAEVKKIVTGWGFPNDKYNWTVSVKATAYVKAKPAITEVLDDNTIATVTNRFPGAKEKIDELKGQNTHVTNAGIKKLYKDEANTLEAADFDKQALSGDDLKFEVQKEVPGVDPEAKATVKPECKDCQPEETPTTTYCPKVCEYITVSLRDVHGNADLSRYTKIFKVNKDVAPDYKSILDVYLDPDFFPWHAWQPVKNYLNNYTVRYPQSIEDCAIIIDVIPRFESIMVIHELWDCCITPDGEVKEELLRSFVEDDVRYRKPAHFNEYGQTVMGTPDGVLEIDFFDFHTGLMVNQDKAAEYAKTRLEKMNAKDFVFQKATFHPNIILSQYFTGEIVNMDGNVVQTLRNGIPTIVIKYLRAECIKKEEQVDDVKVQTNVQTTTPGQQQLPATGAKDVTAFFMSAVALLGLGIFFAKKH